MIIFDLMIVALLIFTITLLSGLKIMFNNKYFQLMVMIFVMYTQLSSLIEGYKLGYTGIISIIVISIIILLIYILGYRRDKYIYYIYNVEENDIINIIENYLERKNIKYEVRNEEIYLLDIDKNIYVHNVISTTLDCREIKGTYFYNELVEEVRVGIKEIKKRYFSLESVLYLIFTMFFFWVRFTFF